MINIEKLATLLEKDEDLKPLQLKIGVNDPKTELKATWKARREIFKVVNDESILFAEKVDFDLDILSTIVDLCKSARIVEETA